MASTTKNNHATWGIVGTLLLVVWGFVLVGMVATGRVVHYLDTPFRIQGLIAGLALIVLALFCFATRKISIGDCGCEHDHHHDHEHAHSHKHGHDHHHDHHHHETKDESDDGHGHDLLFDGGVVAFLVLLFPIVTAVVRSPDKYSISWMQKREKLISVVSAGSVPEGVSKLADASSENPEMKVTLEDVDAMVGKNDAGEYQLSVLELFYVGNDDAFSKVLKGVRVETTGQVVKERLNNPQGNRLRVFRLFVQCCAADARPMSVPVRFANRAPDIKEMSWYQIHGEVDFEEVNGQRIAIIRADQLDQVAEPDQQLAY